MRFAILGYGKMGHEVEKVLMRDGHAIVAVIDSRGDWEERMSAFRSADAAVDFSMPSEAVQNMKNAFENHVPVVVGTTGWHDRLDEVLRLARRSHASFVYGSNFSIGANVFMLINDFLAECMDGQPQYAPNIAETHHIHKKDAPSGTAVTLAEGIIEKVRRLTGWRLAGSGCGCGKGILPVQAKREGEIAGIHRVTWDSPADRIDIIHTAHSRQGFAEGAVKAAVWLHGHPGVYDFKNIVLQLNTRQDVSL